MKLPPAPLASRHPLEVRGPISVLLLPVLSGAVLAAGLAAQAVPASRPADTAYYQLVPERHGASFFPRVRYPQVEYAAGDTLSFDRYHSAEVMYEWLRRWAERYPDLVQRYEVGRSHEGRPILQLTVTNRKTGPAEEKPAAYFEGGRHSGEVSGSESVLWLAQHLIEGYGRDSVVTRLLDTKAIYLRPQNNPDGGGLYLNTAVANRSTVRPWDSDGDGLLDEDEAEDLDGDGVLRQVRWKPTMRGADTLPPNLVPDPRDPSGRLLRNARTGETAVYRVMAEGIDNDGDGRVNEDGIGGLDLHRNYPENWRPMPGQDATQRGWTQGGAGEFPLSEPETRAVVLWLLQHPNVSVVNSMDTRVPMHLRPPSTSRSEERMYPEDLRYYERFDTIGQRLTGFPWAGDVYWVYATRGESDPVSGTPLFGHGPDFGYWYYGAIWYGDELWNGGIYRDENGDGERDQLDALIWDDRDNGGEGFLEWRPFHHPVLGDVEVGGFHPKFFSQNGPPRVLAQVAGDEGRFNLEMARHLPELVWNDTRVRRVAAAGDSATWEVTVGWKNVGRLPTALRQAQLVKIVQEDAVTLTLPRELTSGERPRARIIPDGSAVRADQPRGGPGRGGPGAAAASGGRAQTIRAGWTEPGRSKSVTFRVRTYGGQDPVRADLRLESTRGGVLRGQVEIR